MGLITVNNDRFIANVVVQEIGDLGVAILQVNDEVKPKTLHGNRAQRYRPNGVIIVVNRLEFSLSLTCQYASRISSLLNIRAFASFGSTSSSVVKR
jgi:hypothetical protein